MSTQRKGMFDWRNYHPHPAFFVRQTQNSSCRIPLVDCRRENSTMLPAKFRSSSALPDKVEGSIDEHCDPVPKVLPE
jgi:hypothetical protein